MNNQRSILILSILIGLLAALSASAGLFAGQEGHPFEFTSLHGQIVPMHGSGLYRNESVSGAAQALAQDVVTLALGLPLLVVSLVLYLKGSLRGKLLLTGTLGYFLYTYASLTFLATYNPLFLVYVCLTSMSLFAFILAVQQIDVTKLPSDFSSRLPRRGIASLLFGMALFVGALHLGRIGPALLAGEIPAILESYTTLVISALDLGLIAPTAVLGGILLLKRRPWGYLLAAVLLIKGVTLATAVSAMMINQLISGIHLTALEMFILPALTIVTIYFAVRLLANILPQTVAIDYKA